MSRPSEERQALGELIASVAAGSVLGLIVLLSAWSLPWVVPTAPARAGQPDG